MVFKNLLVFTHYTNHFTTGSIECLRYSCDINKYFYKHTQVVKKNIYNNNNTLIFPPPLKNLVTLNWLRNEDNKFSCVPLPKTFKEKENISLYTKKKGFIKI